MVGRPSNRAARFHQVMEALTHIVARHGLDGASLDLIAKQAGMSRSLVRHHIGNRQAMLAALQDHVLDSFERQRTDLIASLPETGRAEALIDALFSPRHSAAGDDLIGAFAALTTRAAQDVKLQQRCRQSVLDFETELARVLACDRGLTQQAASDASQMITALYFNVISLSPLRMPQGWITAARRLAHSFLHHQEPHP